MGVHIAAALSSACVAAGDTLTLKVTVTAPPGSRDSESFRDESEETISWCSGQVHCVCTADEARVISSDEGSKHQVAPNGTSLTPWRGEKGRVIVTTKPIIIFCDLLVPRGHSETFTYTETIPSHAPPSYRGHNVKYSWKVTVGAQRVGHKISLISLPLRVILLPPLPPPEESNTSQDDSLTPSNPFLRSLPLPTPPSPPSSPPLLQPWGSAGGRSFNIVHGRGHVGKFTIIRSSHKPGDDIVATLDFSEARVPCVQYAVCLQSVEEVATAHRRSATQPAKITSLTKSHEFCMGLRETHLMLPIGPHLTPSFSTDIVSLSYRLHFEFVLSVACKAAEDKENKSDENKSAPVTIYDRGSELEGVWAAPQTLAVETLVWDLPVHVGPTWDRCLLQETSQRVQDPVSQIIV